MAPRKNEVLIIDEADYVLLELLYKPDKGFKYVVGLTASPLSNKNGVEEMHLCKNNYRICDSKVTTSFDANYKFERCSQATFL